MIWTPALAIGGAALAAAPIIIHYIFRRRYRVVDFAAMRFLLESLRRSKQRLRLEEIIIIALRCLACLLLGLMLADLKGGSGAPGGGTRSAHAIILDDSLSMGQRHGSASLFKRAVDDLAKRIAAFGDDDLVAVIAATRPAGDPLIRLAAVKDLKAEGALGRLAALEQGDLAADLPGAVAAAQRILAAQDRLPTRLHLVGDFRRRDLVEPSRRDALRQAFAAVPEAATDVELVDYGQPCHRNLAIERVALGRRSVVAGVPTPIQVVVRNTGDRPVQDAVVTVAAGAALLPARTLRSIAPGETAVADLEYAFPEAGPAALEAALGGDQLPGDDRAALALEVRDALRVLIVDGSPAPGRPGSASFALGRALDPTGKAAFGQRVETVPAEGWTAADAERHDVVILCDVAGFAAGRDDAGRPAWPQVAALERFVRGGGGLAVFLGGRADPDFWRGPMHADGEGLLPLRIAAQVPAPDPRRALRLRADSIAESGERSILRIFTGRSERFAQLIRFHGHVPLDGDGRPAKAGAGGAAEVLACFDDERRSPAAVRRGLGRGAALTWFLLPDTAWSDWPKQLSFLPVMNDMVWSLARAGGEDRHGPVGARIALALGQDLIDATAVELKTPAFPKEDLRTLAPRAEQGRQVVSYADTRHAGLYELAVTLADRSVRKLLFSRARDASESELAKAGKEEIAAAVGRAHAYRAVGAEAEERPADDAARRAAWPLFLIGLLAVLLLESYLAQRFGHHQGGGDARGTPA